MAVVNAIEDRIIGIPFKVEVKSVSGIICDDQQLPQGYVKVISVGPKVEGVKEGDFIMVPKHGGQAMLHNGQIFQAFAPLEIYGVLHPSEMQEEKSQIITV
jgi:co-chaperonin GroES (HSP10)